MKEEFLEKLKKINKDYYTLSDLAKIYGGGKANLKIFLYRLIKNGRLLRLKRDVYILPEKAAGLEKIANQIYFPSYLSFESALSLWGILSQIPYVLTFATSRKSRSYFLSEKKVDYRQLKKDLFFGYFVKNGLCVAWPEKALLDAFYLASMGKLKINFKNLDYSKISLKKFLSWLKKYPEKTQNLAKLNALKFGRK